MAGHTIEHAVIGEIDGQAVDAYRLRGGDTEIEVMTYGAILRRVMRSDRNGRIADIVIGYDDPADYVAKPGNAGAICGRLSNRLALGKFTLDGVDHQLPTNSGPHHLHGGLPGFGKRFWKAEPAPENNAVTFRMESPDGDQGYPGALDATVTYRICEDGALAIEMEAVTDRATILNIIYHGYWNLAGHASGNVESQRLRLLCDSYTVVSEDKIPSGEIVAVAGTPYDFTEMHPIGDRISETWPGVGYDHNLCVAGYDGSMRVVAEAEDPASGRGFTLSTNQPGIQFYTAGHYQAQPTEGKDGALYREFAGFALETQHYPDSPHHENFPSVVLRPGETYRHLMRFDFTAGK
ncbi:aldose epimerase family protein [Martelella lutilitoris]|uniref:aldose epimerase family protein n=1 Tax=Martelella lutilitoris TaxID=2583532 RepID=UPI001FE5A229|nr:aldose epimerase family protein [Martelella lutilitoris]